MTSNLAVELETLCDASLVELSLAGDREAFGQIVARYQSPICALAYSACGNVTRSEDIAQDVFITAWRKLSSLEQPARFKAWLYGIARNLIQNAFRQQARSPVADANTVELSDDSPAPNVNPGEQVISKEEQVILWNVLSSLPEVYREPMVLYYRENESIATVASVLALSEEAVRQRLSRGRALLSERVTKVIENGLRQTKPADAFSAAVVAILPIAATTTAHGAVMGVTTKGAAGHGAGFIGLLKGIGLFAGLIALPVTLGLYFGHKLAQDTRGTFRQRQSAERFWRIFSRGAALLVFAPLLLTFAITGFLKGEPRASFLSGMTYWLGLAYPFVLATIGVWAWQRRGKQANNGMPSDGQRATPVLSTRTAFLMTLAAAALVAFCFLDTRHNVERLSSRDLSQLIESTPAGALKCSVMVQHYRSMWGDSPETFRTLLAEATMNGKKSTYIGAADDAVMTVMQMRKIDCPTYVQGRDFEMLGAPGRFLPLLAAFIFGNGIIFVVKRQRSLKARSGE